MVETHYTPPDYKEMEKYGSCGESCIVVLTKAPSVEGQMQFQNTAYGHTWTNVGEMEEDMKRKHRQTGKGHRKPPAITEVYAMQNVDIFEVMLVFMKYAIRHFTKKLKEAKQWKQD